jgi:hypothetical protein
VRGADRTLSEAAWWTDRADALDRVRRRFDAGALTDRQAERLRTWICDGYVVLDLGTASDRLAPARIAVEQVFAGVVREVRFRCPPLSDVPVQWVPEVTPHPASALDAHLCSDALRSLILAPPVVLFLSQVFDAEPRIVASEAALRPIGHAARRGPADRIGVMIGLDDPPVDAVMRVRPGSHRDSPTAGWVPLTPDFGSVVVWHAGLLHMVEPLSGFAIRRTVSAVVVANDVRGSVG